MFATGLIPWFLDVGHEQRSAGTPWAVRWHLVSCIVGDYCPDSGSDSDSEPASPRLYFPRQRCPASAGAQWHAGSLFSKHVLETRTGAVQVWLCNARTKETRAPAITKKSKRVSERTL